MRYIIIIALTLALNVTSTLAQAVASSESAMKVLSPIGKIERFKLDEMDILSDQAYKALDKVLKYAEAHPTDEKLLDEIIRVASFASSLDPAHTSGQMLLPLYKKAKKLMDKLIDKLPVKEKKILHLHLKGAADEEKLGNG